LTTTCGIFFLTNKKPVSVTNRFFNIQFDFYLLPENLLMINIMTAITAITIKIPTPIPALKIPSTSSQLVAVNKIIKSNNGFKILWFMVLVFVRIIINVNFQKPTLNHLTIFGKFVTALFMLEDKW